MTRAQTHDALMVVAVILILLLVNIPYVNLLIALILVLIYSYKKGGIKVELGYSRPSSFLKTIALAAGLGIATVIASYLLFIPIFKTITGVPLSLGAFEQLKGNVGLLVTSLFLGWIIGGFLEETVFRAFLISRFEKLIPTKIGLVIGVVLTSTLFGYLHTYQGPTGQLLTGTVGLTMALIYVFNKRNIWLCIFTHGFVNTFSMLFLYFGVFDVG